MKTKTIRLNGGPHDGKMEMIPDEQTAYKIGMPFQDRVFFYNIADNEAFYNGINKDAKEHLEEMAEKSAASVIAFLDRLASCGGESCDGCDREWECDD